MVMFKFFKKTKQIIKLWYAVDVDGRGFLYYDKPHRNNFKWESIGEYIDVPDFINVPSIKWIDEPVLIKFKIEY